MNVFALRSDGQRLPAHRVPIGCDDHAEDNEVAIVQAVDHTIDHRHVARALRPVQLGGAGFPTSAGVENPILFAHPLERLVASWAQHHTLTSRKAFQAASGERRCPAAILRVI
jgi:hypothetical protein